MTQEELEEFELSSTSTSGVVKLEDLVKRKADGATASKTNAAFLEETLKSLNPGAGIRGDEGEVRDECPLCLDIMEAPVLIPPCMHKWYAQRIRSFEFERVTGLDLQLQGLCREFP
jgi:hypothetical protein